VSAQQRRRSRPHEFSSRYRSREDFHRAAPVVLEVRASEWFAGTGVPVLVNTSIVCTPLDAVGCSSTAPFDALLIGSWLEKA